jgi:hypothetical protein
MTTSLNNVRLIEAYLQNKLSPLHRLMFEARLILNPALRSDLCFQEKTYHLVKMYHRKQLKEEFEDMYQRICSNPDNVVFEQNIHRLFKTKKP